MLLLAEFRSFRNSALMRVLSTVRKRLWDAVRAFFAVLSGRVTAKKLTPTQKVKHAAALQNDLLEVASLLEKMHAWTSRMAARDSRAAKKLLDESTGPTEEAAVAGVSTAMNPRDRKQMLRAYFTAQQFGGGSPPPPPPVALPAENPNGDEPLEVEAEP